MIIIIIIIKLLPKWFVGWGGGVRGEEDGELSDLLGRGKGLRGLLLGQKRARGLVVGHSQRCRTRLDLPANIN
jgi:hypothetical protein